MEFEDSSARMPFPLAPDEANERNPLLTSRRRIPFEKLLTHSRNSLLLRNPTLRFLIHKSMSYLKRIQSNHSLPVLISFSHRCLVLTFRLFPTGFLSKVTPSHPLITKIHLDAVHLALLSSFLTSTFQPKFHMHFLCG